MAKKKTIRPVAKVSKAPAGKAEMFVVYRRQMNKAEAGYSDVVIVMANNHEDALELSGLFPGAGGATIVVLRTKTRKRLERGFKHDLNNPRPGTQTVEMRYNPPC